MKVKNQIAMINVIATIVYKPIMYKLGFKTLAKWAINLWTQKEYNSIPKEDGLINLDKCTKAQFHIIWMRELGQL